MTKAESFMDILQKTEDSSEHRLNFIFQIYGFILTKVKEKKRNKLVFFIGIAFSFKGMLYDRGP